MIGLCRMPGWGGDYAGDLALIRAWVPGLVMTMTTRAELRSRGAGRFPDDLAASGITWRHLPVTDFGAGGPGLRDGWPEASAAAHSLLGQGGRVLAHCMGGCGRSGMALMRLMVEAGEPADHALARLRNARPCAVETEEQRAWAATPM